MKTLKLNQVENVEGGGCISDWKVAIPMVVSTLILGFTSGSVGWVAYAGFAVGDYIV